MRWLFVCLFLLNHTSYSQQVGVISDTVVCQQNNDQSYALYLPSYYTPSKKWPAIFVFEPAARGRLPVTKFRRAAEELGYIIIASNNSKNGSWDLAFDAADAMFLDALDRFGIDPNRVYTSGFSGGSRVASAVAALTGKINGVIACGAGFSSISDYRLQQNSGVMYVAIVGNQDMNYQEHRMLTEELEQKNITNHLILFNGGHQWPQPNYIYEALLRIELQQFIKKKKVSDRFSIKHAYETFTTRADSVLLNGNYVQALESNKKIILDFENLMDVKSLIVKVDSLADTKEYKKQLKQQAKIAQQESVLRKEIWDAFTELYFTQLKASGDSGLKDKYWWHSKIDFFKKLANKDDFQIKNMGRRMVNAVWARCAESANNYINQQEYETARVLTEIWLYTEPNLWGKWTMATVLAYQSDINFFSYLREVAHETQSIDKHMIQQHPAFKKYLNHDQMREIFSLVQ